MTESVTTALVAWAERQTDVRALVLTSTRAIADAPTDIYSDYDVILVTTDLENRYTNRDWLQTFGKVVIDWWDPLEPDRETGISCASGVVYYPGTRKIDFTLWPPEMAGAMSDTLGTELDAGYQVLMDKDGLTANWRAPTGVGYAKSLPDCDRYREAVRDFFIGVPYVVTALLRGEILQAKWVLDYDMRYEYLLPMLEWYAVSIHGSDVRIGVNGKGLHKLLPFETWSLFEQTYADLDVASNRRALFAMIHLFREVAAHVGEAIGCAYPDDLHERVMKHIAALENM